MAAPSVPYYGKDTERLAMLNIACNALLEAEELIKSWPVTVTHPTVFQRKIDLYQDAYHEALHCDRRAIAKRVDACEEAGSIWQKIVNYLCATETDNSALLEQMGVSNKTRRSTTTPATLVAPDLNVVNLDERGAVRARCSRERRRYTHCIEVTEGDPRNDDGWYPKASFGDCTDMIMYGFQSGKQYSFRCRIIGRNNEVGPWSLVVTLVVT